MKRLILPSMILSVSSVLFIGLMYAPKAQAQEPKDCQVGGVCILRPQYNRDLVFASQKAFDRFRRLQARHVPDPLSKFEIFDRIGTEKEKGDLIVCFSPMEIRALSVNSDGSMEAIVLKDTYQPSPDGIGMIGARFVGHKVWLENPQRWAARQ